MKGPREPGGRGFTGEVRRLMRHLQHLIRDGTRGLVFISAPNETLGGSQEENARPTRAAGIETAGNLLEFTAHTEYACVCVCGEQMGRAQRSSVHYLRACLQTTTMQPALITCNQTWQLIWAANVCLGLSARRALTCVCGIQCRRHQTPPVPVQLCR